MENPAEASRPAGEFVKSAVEFFKGKYAAKFASLDEIFSHVRRGCRIFIGTGCAEPQYLVKSLIKFAEARPKAIIDAEILHVWTLGVAPYADEKFKDNFRYGSFFVGPGTRAAVNEGRADYTPVFLSKVPELFHRRLIPIDAALVQTSPPDEHGYLSLGIGVDIVKAAVEAAGIVIAQINFNMPRTHGDGFLHIKDVDYIVAHDEPLLVYEPEADCDIAMRIGRNVARLVADGDTIQVGYGSLPNAVMAHLGEKKHLGVHTELISRGLVELIKKGVVDNSKKTINRGKTVASFCMGGPRTYAFVHNNPTIEFRVIDYTNNPMIIARHDNMTAINSAVEIDLTGQASAESLGGLFFSGIGGQADFMRGALMAENGKTILAMPSTAEGDTVSRIVPYLKEGAGVTLNRGDVRYVVTEYGIAYLHGKNVRQRAMELIAIAHPKFRQGLVEKASALNLIYGDQAFVPGEKGLYPHDLEVFTTTAGGLDVFIRPVKLSDEPLLKDFFYSLSDEALYRRFISARRDVPHEMLQGFTAIDYGRDLVLLAFQAEHQPRGLIGMAQYRLDERYNTAEVSFVVQEDFQGRGVGRELFRQLFNAAVKRGFFGFTAEVLADNRTMLRVFEKSCIRCEKKYEEGMCRVDMRF